MAHITVPSVGELAKGRTSPRAPTASAPSESNQERDGDAGMTEPCLICLEDGLSGGGYHPKCLKELFGVRRAPAVDVELAKRIRCIDPVWST
jgi:hypothetical protein